MRPVWVVSVRVGDLLTRKTLNKAVASDGRPSPSGPKSTALARSQPQSPGLHPFPSVRGGPPQALALAVTLSSRGVPSQRPSTLKPGRPWFSITPRPALFRVPVTLWNGRPTFSTRLAGADRVGYRALVRLDERDLGSGRGRRAAGSGGASLPFRARSPLRPAGRALREIQVGPGGGAGDWGTRERGGSQSRGLLLSKPRHSGVFELGAALGWCNRPRKKQVKISAPKPKGTIAHEFIAVSAQDSVKLEIKEWLPPYRMLVLADLGFLLSWVA